jgi:hypothetical protein
VVKVSDLIREFDTRHDTDHLACDLGQVILLRLLRPLNET